MDLRGLANSVSSSVNGNITVTVTASAGYTAGNAGNGYKQTPNTATPVSGPAQVQALNSVELKQLDGMNLQGVIQAIYLRGNLAGVVRATSQGGDIVTIAAPAPLQWQGTWLVVKVLESWPYWTKCAINLQSGAQ